ncbi:hypothetical protein KR074_001199 [Drosophila pseudoananassae]|nr:hypothetical protein KR074_001199 [Drosophila pseudoananassae]
MKNTLVLVVVLLALHLEASKIAYKKPLYGKTNFIKDKRMKSKPIKEGTTTTTTSSTTTTTTSTTEENWPAPVEFVIVTTPKAILDSTTEWHGRNGSTTEIFSTTPETGSTKTEGSGEEVGAPPQAESSNEVSSTYPMSTTTSSSVTNTIPSPPTPESVMVQPQDNQPVPCTCGVFLSSQIQNGLPTAPLIHQELDRTFPCNAIGRKQCQTKCLEAIVQHLPNSANIVCSALGHDCHKERAYLFIKNCHNQWVNTNLQAGREYCCRGGLPYRCPLMG